MPGGLICRLSIDHHGIQRYHPCTFPIADSSPGAQHNAFLVESKFCTNRFYRRVFIAVALSNCNHSSTFSTFLLQSGNVLSCIPPTADETSSEFSTKDTQSVWLKLVSSLATISPSHMLGWGLVFSQPSFNQAAWPYFSYFNGYLDNVGGKQRFFCFYSRYLVALSLTLFFTVLELIGFFSGLSMFTTLPNMFCILQNALW